MLQVFASRETNVRVISARKKAFTDRPRRWWHRLDWYGPVDLSRADGHADISITQAMLRPWKVQLVDDLQFKQHQKDHADLVLIFSLFLLRQLSGSFAFTQGLCMDFFTYY